MSIKPPSDIVMDVALAADPARRDLATRKLASAAGDLPSFATVLAGTSSTLPGTPQPNVTVGAVGAGETKPKTLSDAMRGLETVFLRNAFETMLPDTSRKAGIAGAGAGVWKSMLADALANSVSAAGGIGIVPQSHDLPRTDPGRAS